MHFSMTDVLLKKSEGKLKILGINKMNKTNKKLKKGKILRIKWKYNISESMGYSKGSSKGKVYSYEFLH
jgi:hypothetical protein